MTQVISNPQDMLPLLQTVRQPLYLLRQSTTELLGLSDTNQHDDTWQAFALLPALYPEWLGNQGFLTTHGVRFPYVAGAMAHGITSAAMVVAMAQADMLCFFGAAGMPLKHIETGLQQIQTELGTEKTNWGSNLIYMPNDPEVETAIVDLYLKYNVHRVSASAYMRVNANIVRYACKGLYRDQDGQIQRQNYVFPKLSQPRLAAQFMTPPPEKILQELVSQNQITAEEAELASQLPLAEDITVESDSGGHTDNRPLGPLFSRVLQLRQELTEQYNYSRPIRVGAAGGLGTPAAVAGAFAMGADYVVTGSVNQSAVEAGLSEDAKKMLAQAEVTDMAITPAADMFEMGAKMQVLKKGTLFPGRANRLGEWYKQYKSIDEFPPAVQEKLETEILQAKVEDIWEQTRAFFKQNNPKVLANAEQDPKVKMALIFRWYLGKSGRWAIDGFEERRTDYQIYSGPAIGAFNAWAAGSCLEKLENRSVVQIALNLLEGAAVITRAQQVRNFGIMIPETAFCYQPMIF